jgi:glycine C-acetyltransferase
MLVGHAQRERTIVSPQSSSISVKERSEPVINFCANNYLGASSVSSSLLACHADRAMPSCRSC